MGTMRSYAATVANRMGPGLSTERIHFFWPRVSLETNQLGRRQVGSKPASWANLNPLMSGTGRRTCCGWVSLSR